MPAPISDSFLGYKPNVANAPFNSAVTGKNFVIHRHRDPKNPRAGWIEQADGYAEKFSALPVNDTVIRKISGIAINPVFYNLYIPEHGGQNVTVVTATYTKTGFFPASPTVNRFGIWIRPYWSGAAWIDAWRELTEMFIFELDALGLDDEFLLMTGWTSTGWQGDWGNGWSHDTGNTSVLSQSKPAVSGRRYKITYTVTLRTAGTFDISFGGHAAEGLSESGVFEATTVSTAGLSITPTTDFDGTIVISIKAYNRKLYLDDAAASKYEFPTIDPTGTVFTADYFKDWTIVYDAFGDSENYDLVGGSGYDASRYYLELIPGHYNTDFTTRVAGTKLLVYRAFVTKELPSTLSTFIYGLLSEARVTSGNTAADVILAVGDKAASFVQTGAITYTRTVAQVIAQPATFDIWAYCAVAGLTVVPSDPADALAAGTWYVKYSIVLDDGNESKLFNAVTSVGGLWSSAVNSFVIGTDEKLFLENYRSWGAMPLRARYMRIYLSQDDVAFYRVKDIDLRHATAWTLGLKAGTAVLGGDHWYSYYTDYLTGADWEAAGSNSIEQRGGTVDADTGVIQCANACVVGRRVYAFQVRAGGTLYPNHIFTTPANGDGGLMLDTFPTLATSMLDLEYNDGDQLICGYPSRDNLLVFKRRSVSLVSASTSGDAVTFNRDAITKSDGICSGKTLADFEDTVYWAGYNGIYSYSNQGVKLLNEDWLLEWKALSVSYKEAAIGVIDRTNRQYRIGFQTGAATYCERIVDIDTGEWVPVVLTDQPSGYSVNQREGTVDFISGSLIHTLGSGTRHNGVNFTMEYINNDFIASQIQNIDALLRDIRIAYESDVALTVTIYRDGVAQSPVALAAGNGASTVKAGLSFRCKHFALRILATTTAADQSIIIKEIVPRFQLISGGVSRPAFASEGSAAAIEQRPMAMADIRSGRETLVANVLKTVVFTTPFSTIVGTNYELKADIFNDADEWIMSVIPTNLTRYGFDVTSPESGYVGYTATAHQ